MNPFDMMKNLKDMQAKMAEAQSRIQAMVEDGQAGGGIVRVRMDGTFMVKKVEIDPSLLNDEDREMVADLVVVASQDAHRKIQEKIKVEMTGVTGGMSIPGLF